MCCPCSKNMIPARPQTAKNTTKITKKYPKKLHENASKVGSYSRFDLKVGTGLKFPAKPTPVELHSSHSSTYGTPALASKYRGLKVKNETQVIEKQNSNFKKC